ncbi:MAG: MFS transporter [Syntrophales bacterium]|nr:MFS transporter [Syntrophales bacterium]MDY0045269.1 MFS transporter [Syntrophales bacterium]
MKRLSGKRRPELMDSREYPPPCLSWIIWGLGAALYLSGFYQRVAPAVMTDHLMADFSIGAASLGNLSAFYFYSYVAMQIPTGILADSWGPKKLLTAGAFTAGIGTLLFAAAPAIIFANAGRLLIGGAVGVAWVALLKLTMNWFPPRQYALTTGLALFCGVIGAVSAGVPLRIMVDHFGWRPVMLASAVLSLVVAIAILLIVRDDPSKKGYTGFLPSVGVKSHTAASLLAGLLKVFRYKNTWLLSLAPAGVAGPVLAFSGLWGVPFLSTHYNLSPAGSAAVTSVLLIAWAFGGPVLGAMSDRIGRRKPLYAAGSLAACAGWGMILFVPQWPVWVLIALASIVGFASGTVIIGFAFVKESVPPSLTGTVSGVCNMGAMIGPMVLQPAMGWVLDKNWSGIMEKGIKIYGLDAYQSAFGLMIAGSILAAVLVLFTTETYCRQKVND